MTQKISPFVDGKYGWDFGESGWNVGADENFLKFSYLFDRNVDAIVSTLPTAPSNGQAFFLTTDNRMYFRVESTWYSSPTPKWFEFQIRSTGVVYRFNGTGVSVVESPSSFDNRIDALEVTVSNLGTAAFQDSSNFAAQGQLDVVSAQAAAYTDEFKNNLLGPLSDGKGAALVNGAFRYFDSTVTVRIPTDYSTLQAAFNAYQNARTPSGQQIVLLIESGHAPASGLTVSNGDFGHFTISAEDPLVTVAPQFSGYFLSVRNAVAPTLSCKVDQALFGASGLRYDVNSTGLIDPGCGVIRAGENGMLVYSGSRIVCLSSVFDGAANTGVSVQGSSTLMGNNSSIKDCGGSGLVIGSSSNVTIRSSDISGCVKGTPGTVSGAIIADRSSVLDARGCNCQNSGWKGVWIDNGTIANLRDVNVSGAVDDGIFVTRGSSAHCEGAIADNIGNTALDVQIGCTVDALSFSSNTAGNLGLNVTGGSTVNAELSVFTSAAVSIRNSTVSLVSGKVLSPVGNGVSIYASTLYATSLEVTDATGIGLTSQASWVSAQFATIQNSGGKGVTATQGSHVVLRGGTISGNTIRDLEVTQGSQIFATTATTTTGAGSPALADTNVTGFNSISGNSGIIWD